MRRVAANCRLTLKAAMSQPILCADQLEQFARDGYTLLRGAFPRALAEDVRAALWRELEKEGVQRAAPDTWREVVHIQKSFGGEPFTRVWQPRVLAALDQLLGAGRYWVPNTLGWWPVAFPGFAAPPWTAPDKGWHVDGIQFHHHLNSRDQGLLPLFIFSDIARGEGGTAVCPGSHGVAARILAASEPEGLDVHQLAGRVCAAIPDLTARAVELTGEPGDVALLHPFMLHARSVKTGGDVRFICNPAVGLHEPMNFDPARRALSPVEAAIAAASETAPV